VVVKEEGANPTEVLRAADWRCGDVAKALWIAKNLGRAVCGNMLRVRCAALPGRLRESSKYFYAEKELRSPN